MYKSKIKKMFKIKFLSLLVITILPNIQYAQFTDAINSNRPGESMTAFSVGKTVIQAELGFYGIKEDHSVKNYTISGYGSDLTVRYGAFLEQLELIMNLEYQNDKYISPFIEENRSGLKKTTFGAKYLLYDPDKNYKKKINVYSWKANHKFSWRQFIPAVGLYGGLHVNLSNNAFAKSIYQIEIPVDPKITTRAILLTQNQFGKSVLVGNIIIDKFPSIKRSLDYVVTLTRVISPRFSGFIEAQGFNGSYYKDTFLRGGGAFLLRENIQLDASISKNFKETPNILIGGVGIAWRFDQNYNDILLRIPKDKEAKGKKGKDKKKDKKKEKAKKRLDEIEGEKK
jgi:Putative MetA-pathway of phenol degradation